jgi:hypothetical protein
MITKYEEGYINPDAAKKIVLIKQQFKAERNRMITKGTRIN